MHIGHKIRQELKRQRRSATWLANKICVTRTHVYKILNKESIDTSLLWRISIALNCDFFSEYSVMIDKNRTNRVTDTWYQENNSGIIITITFKSNQEGSVKYEYKSGSDMTEYFEYSLTTDRDGYTTLYITSDDCQLTGEFEVKVTPSTLTLIGNINGSFGQYQFKKK